MGKAFANIAVVVVIAIGSFMFGKAKGCGGGIPSFTPMPQFIDSAAYWQRYLPRLPQGMQVKPDQVTTTDRPVRIRVAGCPPAASAPPALAVGDTSQSLARDTTPVSPERGIETILGITLRPGRLEVSRYTNNSTAQTTSYPINERGNRLSIVTTDSVPAVVPDNWAWVRDIELVGVVGPSVWLGAVKFPVSESFSIGAGFGNGDKVIVGSWRPFVRWPK